MRRRIRRFLGAGVLTAGIAMGMPLSLPMALADGMQPMSISDMQSQIIGNSLAGMTESGDAYVEYYQPDGKIVGQSKADGTYEGAWSFRQDGLMCFKYGDGPFDGGCVHVTRDGSQIGFMRVDGSHEPGATLIPGKAGDLK